MAFDHLVPAAAGQEFPMIAETLISTFWKGKEEKTEQKKRQKSARAGLLLDHASRQMTKRLIPLGLVLVLWLGQHQRRAVQILRVTE
jgi:hypothetical protein